MKIVIDIKGEEVSLETQEARELYDKLVIVFGGGMIPQKFGNQPPYISESYDDILPKGKIDKLVTENFFELGAP